ncbi:MAG: hypothetical protein IPL73_23685 [Candidatus Obscuribacter sp.]|nr:hypothetical protein [Candidatus Obscuribacter sp.]
MSVSKSKSENFYSDDWHDLGNRLDMLIAKHNAYNDREDSRYSRQILSSLNLALFAATCAINGAYNEALRKKSLSPIVSAVSSVRAEYQPDNEDEGYGCGCLGSLLDSLCELQREFINRGFEQPIAELHNSKVNYRQRVNEEKIGIERIAKEFGFSKIEFLRANKAHPDEIVLKVRQAGNNELAEHRMNECTLALSRLLRFQIILKFDTEQSGLFW